MTRKELKVAKSKAKKYLGRYECGIIWGISGSSCVKIYGTTAEVLEKYAPDEINGITVNKEVLSRE